MNYTIKIVNFTQHEKEIRFVRNTVFTDEQGISSSIDFDGRCIDCYHVLAWNDDGQPIGTGRMQKNGHIGRLAVIAEWRGYGIGTAMLDEFITFAQSVGLKQVYLNSQEQAVEFYEKCGFIIDGEIFYEANIPHIKMVRPLE